MADELHSLQQDLERTREELRDLQLRFDLAARTSRDGFWDWNLQTNRVYFSPLFQQMVGCAEKELGDSPDEWLHRIHPEDLSFCRSSLELMIAGQSENFEN